MSDKPNRFPLKVSNTVVRIVAAEVFAVSLTAIFLHSRWLAFALALDFAIRAFVTPIFSPLRIVGSYAIRPLLGTSDAPVFFSPKRFAAAIGFFLCAIAVAGFSTSVRPVADSALALLTVFSFLEATFGFCAGCKIYGFLMRHGIIPTNWCPECVNM
jgi:hypothetical protein